MYSSYLGHGQLATIKRCSVLSIGESYLGNNQLTVLYRIPVCLVSTSVTILTIH